MAHKYFGWHIYLGKQPYKAALQFQEKMVEYRLHGSIRDTFFFLSHPNTFTIGSDYSSKYKDKIGDTEVVKISRGGGITYHGPGQLVAYPIFNLQRHGCDLHKFIYNLEEGIIRAFAEYGLSCKRHPEHTGVWVNGKKIASIGIAVKRWISYHGIAVNLSTDLKQFMAINPCGLNPEIMTTAKSELGIDIGIEEFALKLTEKYSEIFDTDFAGTGMEEISEIIDLEESSQSL